jgi:hypothetical protein
MIGERLESIKRLDHDWDLRFDGGSSLMFQSVWRLVSDAAIEVTSEDEGQQFGLKTPIDAVAQLKAKIGDKCVSDVRIDGVTSDLTLYFGQDLRFEVVSTSSGYEAWSLHAKEVQIIGRNGDTLFSRRQRQHDWRNIAITLTDREHDITREHDVAHPRI